ncbi:hypothetical protein LCGC14_2839770 [marine sediment metagenome]|uniref:Uncharacterized protein n=1 Tax=marine sediment metagenome TaxID=412755 RepID=A0A0F9B2M8_9ZZZZ
MNDWRVAVAAILGIVALEMMALYMGHDGLILVSIVAVIAAIAGVTADQVVARSRKK